MAKHPREGNMETVIGRERLLARPVLTYLGTMLTFAFLASLDWLFSYSLSPLPAVWLPAGLAVALLICGGFSRLPVVVAGVLVSVALQVWGMVHSQQPVSPLQALTLWLANLVEPVVIALIYRKVAADNHPLRDYRAYLRLLGAACVGCVVSALPIVAAFGGFEGHSASRLSSTVLLQWMSHLLGIVTVAPVVIAALMPQTSRRWLKRPLEWTLWLAALSTIAAIAHIQEFGVIYLVLPLMAWAATRFSLPGSMLAIAIADLVAMAQIAFSQSSGVLANDQALLQATVVLIMTSVAGYIRSLLEDRRQVETSLEKIVEERTRELQLMNFELRDEIFVRQQAEKSFRRSSRHYRALVETASNPIIVIDRKCIILQWNGAAELLYGYGREDAKGLNLLEAFIPKVQQDEMAWKITKVLTSGVLRESVETEAFGYEGTRHIMLWNINRLPSDDAEEPPQVILVGQDITEIRDTQDKLHYLAHYDALTGTANRRLFEDRCRQAIEGALRYGHDSALISLDLDHFKRINDTLGHDAGDELLKTLSERLRACVRREDTIARLGGDEFAVLLNKVAGPEGCEKVARHILQSVTQPIRVRTGELVVTTSIGITLAPNDGTQYEELLKNADMAMYRAKNAGRNNIQFFSPDMNEELQRQIQLEQELREALSTSQLDLYYQPVVDLQTGDIVAMEALLRWHHPQRGLLQPEDFMDIAEQTGLLMQLGEWAILNACLQARAIQAMSTRPILVSINLSERQYHHPQLPQILKRVIRETRVDPHLVSLEIDERLLRERPEDAVLLLHRLKDLGLQLVLDRFGSGLSSIRLLGELPFDHVKIDRELIKPISENNNAAAIVRTLINLSRQLSRSVIANGVESAEQERILRSTGCELAQGHRFSQAIPSDRLAEIFEFTRSGQHLLHGNQFILPLADEIVPPR